MRGSPSGLAETGPGARTARYTADTNFEEGCPRAGG